MVDPTSTKLNIKMSIAVFISQFQTMTQFFKSQFVFQKQIVFRLKLVAFFHSNYVFFTVMLIIHFLLHGTLTLIVKFSCIKL